MMTVITRIKLKQGAEPEWDAAMSQRLEAAKGRAGWVGGQLLMPLDVLSERLIVGTWETRADWEAWHEDEGVPGNARAGGSAAGTTRDHDVARSPLRRAISVTRVNSYSRDPANDSCMCSEAFTRSRNEPDWERPSFPLILREVRVDESHSATPRLKLAGPGGHNILTQSLCDL